MGVLLSNFVPPAVVPVAGLLVALNALSPNSFALVGLLFLNSSYALLISALDEYVLPPIVYVWVGFGVDDEGFD